MEQQVKQMARVQTKCEAFGRATKRQLRTKIRQGVAQNVAPMSVVLTGFSYSSSSSEPLAELRFLSVSTGTPETASSSPETSVSLMSWGLNEKAPLGTKVEMMMTAARTVKWTPAMFVRTVWKVEGRAGSA